VLTTNQKGALAEAKIAAAAIEAGIVVARPLEAGRYDLIFDLGERLLRIQCKWAARRGGVLVIRCRGCRRGREGLIHRAYEPGEIDGIAAYCRDLDQTYLLPVELSCRRAVVQLRLSPARNNQFAGINWARDFELAATLGRILGP